MDVLVFNPLYQERVWGGRALENLLGRKLPEGKVIGESWELVDRPEAQSVVARGPLAGKTLRSVIEDQAEELMGPGWPPARRFPILVKWLDCQERLSLQVHPPAAIAPSLGGEPKTENWYVVETTGDAAVLAGLKPGVTRDSFEAALRDNRLEALVHRLPTRPGDSLFVRSGRLHAIDAGNLILEIQQNSDTTYRVYDWGRTGLDGKPRQLHVAESLKSIDFGDFEPRLLHARSEETVLADAAEFRLRRLPLIAGQRVHFAAREEPRLLSIAGGTLRDEASGATYTLGDNLLLPYDAQVSLNATAPSVVLITDRFR